MTKWIVSAVAILCWSTFVCAGSADGEAAYNRGDYPTAFLAFKQAAEQGNVVAQYYLAQMYREGQGVTRDGLLAMKWLHRAAEQGYAVAALSLGFMYYKGEGVSRDFVQAYMWLDFAASQTAYRTKRDAIREDRDKVAALMTPAQIAQAQYFSRQMVLKITGPHCDVG